MPNIHNTPRHDLMALLNRGTPVAWVVMFKNSNSHFLLDDPNSLDLWLQSDCTIVALSADTTSKKINTLLCRDHVATCEQNLFRSEHPLEEPCLMCLLADLTPPPVKSPKMTVPDWEPKIVQYRKDIYASTNDESLYINLLKAKGFCESLLFFGLIKERECNRLINSMDRSAHGRALELQGKGWMPCQPVKDGD